MELFLKLKKYNAYSYDNFSKRWKKIKTIDPMINQGKRHCKLLPDEWTVVTKDHKLSAQWEHTILVTADGFEILTLREEEKSLFS